MFWDQMYRQIEHSGESRISEIYTESFWNLGTSILYCHFYYHLINIFPKGQRRFFFFLYFSNTLHFSICKTLCRMLWLKQDLFPFTVSLGAFCHLKVHIHWQEPCMFPQGDPSPSYLARARDLQARERLHLFLIIPGDFSQIVWDISRIADFGLRKPVNV